jgi:hypothetical protein
MGEIIAPRALSAMLDRPIYEAVPHARRYDLGPARGEAKADR